MTIEEIKKALESRDFKVSVAEFLGLEQFTFEDDMIEGTFTRETGNDKFSHISFYSKGAETACEWGFKIVRKLFEKDKSVEKIHDYINAYKKTYCLMVDLGI